VERLTAWSTAFKPKNNSPIVRDSNRDEPSAAPQRRSRTDWTWKINRPRTVIDDVRPWKFLTVSGFDGDPEHPILPDAWRWELIEFTYRRDLADWRESHIEMVFRQNGVERRLRFLSPQDLELSQGLPTSTGMRILDVSGRQLDGLRVRVASFEQSYGTPTFWAASVIEVLE
jgi:hypothetical protein